MRVDSFAPYLWVLVGVYSLIRMIAINKELSQNVESSAEEKEEIKWK